MMRQQQQQQNSSIYWQMNFGGMNVTQQQPQQQNDHLVSFVQNGFLLCRQNGFYGEKIRSWKENAFGSRFWKHLGEKGRRNSKPGVTYFVLTRDINKELAALQSKPFPEEHRNANPAAVASIILDGGSGTRLFPLTCRRAKPAMRQDLSYI